MTTGTVPAPATIRRRARLTERHRLRMVGAAALAAGDRVLLRLPALSRLRHRAADHDPVRALARPRARLCRHHHARPRRVLRRRRLYGRHAGQARHLDRADHAACSSPRRSAALVGLRLGPGAAAHHRPDAADAHALHHGAARGSRQHGPRLHRRLRRARQPADLAAVRPVRVQSALFQHAISLRAGACCSSASCSCARWSIRRSARA